MRIQWNLSNPDTIGADLIEIQRLLEVVKYTNVAFGTDESVLFREVSLIQGVLIERFHCIYVCMYILAMGG